MKKGELRVDLLCGISHAGKTTLAHALSEADNSAVIVSFSKIQQNEMQAVDQDKFEGMSTNKIIKTWVHTSRLAELCILACLHGGRSVIYDGASPYEMHRWLLRGAIHRLQAMPYILFVDTPPEVAMQRRAEVQRFGVFTPERTEVSQTSFEMLAEIFEPPLPDEYPISLCPEDKLSRWLDGLPSMREQVRRQPFVNKYDREQNATRPNMPLSSSGVSIVTETLHALNIDIPPLTGSEELVPTTYAFLDHYGSAVFSHMNLPTTTL